MIDLSKIKFTTTPEGIRCAGEVVTQQCVTIYIHRFDVGSILGLQRTDGSDRIFWDRLLDAYNKVSSFVENPGFSTLENAPSYKPKPSQYELQLPEYIRKGGYI